MFNRRPAPTIVPDPSPLRVDLDRAARVPAELLLQTAGPWRPMMVKALASRGLDSTALTSRGILAQLTDAELAVLLRAVADRIDQVLLKPMDDEPLPTLEEALEALARALR